ncbi:conserved oligomeric Golgi complex subunit 5 [Episyrphus balteatus]|uniref:conserved oligomeric Golgi complex subunit 5 n=1 Tax=Episyrphus balteatus TaxID=286459 RepID=UPI0024854E07|nr:conserved oligomeric Golgi complex subunit 5 [Episyrphus balteatus]
MTQKNIYQEIEENDFYKVFLDEKADKSPIANMTISTQIHELSKGLETISFELKSQVREQHGALLSQATHAGRLDVALNTVSGDVERIQATAHRLKNQLDSQYSLIENQTRVLGNLHEVSHVLRSCGNLLNLTQKLKDTKDVLKQASIHFELEPLIEDSDLNRIDFIQEERAYVISSRQKIKNLAQMQLVNGLKERNEIQVANTIKIFINFQTLDVSLDNLVATFIAEIDQSLKECFSGTDISAFNSSGSQIDKVPSSNRSPGGGTSLSSRGPGKAPLLTTTQNFRAKLWKSLHWLIYDELYEYCEQIILLRKSLEEVNQLARVSDNEISIEKKFWKSVEDLFRKSFKECSAHISQALQEGLSKLLSSARGLQARLGSQFVFDDSIFEPLEVGYLTKCAANMKACLAGVDLPSNETVDAFIRVASTELSAAMVDTNLANNVANVFNSCSKDFWSKMEAQIKLGTDSKQVVDIPNIPQTQNINLANILFYHSDSVKRMIWNLGENFCKSEPAETVMKSLQQGEHLVQAILQQLMDSMISTIGIILLSMHREPGLNSEKIAIAGPSMYMKELQEFIYRAWNNHAVPFDDKETTCKCGEQLAIRCIDLFVNNLVILRPLSSAGRNRLKNDCIFLENALKTIAPNLSELGKPFRLLRAMSSLILQKPEELVEHSIEKESPVPSYIILFLLFGHGGMELQSPHTAANWSNERLIQWLEGHTSEREKLELISGALQRYRDITRRKNTTQYDPVYPHLSSYFEKALQSLK